MIVNRLSLVKITIIDGTPIEAPETESQEFIYHVDEEIGNDFDDHKGEDQVDEEIK